MTEIDFGKSATFENTFSKYSTQETLEGGLKLFEDSEKAVIFALYHAPNALSIKEIRTEVITRLVKKARLDYRIETKELNITKIMEIPRVSIEQAEIMNDLSDLSKQLGADEVSKNWKNKAKPLRNVVIGLNGKPVWSFEAKDMADLRKQAFNGEVELRFRLKLVEQLVKAPSEQMELIGAILAKEGYCKIPSFDTIETALRNLLRQGYLVWREAGNKRNTKGLFALNPKFYQQLKGAGVENFE